MKIVVLDDGSLPEELLEKLELEGYEIISEAELSDRLSFSPPTPCEVPYLYDTMAEVKVNTQE